MKGLKSMKSLDFPSASNLAKKEEIPSKKKSLITKLNIINILDKRRAKKNYNLSSDHPFEKFEILTTQENLKSKTPKNLSNNLINFNNNYLNNFISNTNSELNNTSKELKNMYLSRNCIVNINDTNNEIKAISSNNNTDSNYNFTNSKLKNAKNASLNFNCNDNNNNLSNGNNANNANLITKQNKEINSKGSFTMNSFVMRKNFSTKTINDKPNGVNNRESNGSFNANNINFHFKSNKNNQKVIIKKGKSNLSGSYNHNFNLFVKPKICVNIINNNDNGINIDNLNNIDYSKNPISSRRKNNKSVSTDRKYGNSLDFSNAKLLKNNKSKANINIKKQFINSQFNNYLNSKVNKTETAFKNMIENELANSLVKGNYACPMSPQIHRSNLLNKYLSTDETCTQQSSEFICYSSNKLFNQKIDLPINNAININTVYNKNKNDNSNQNSNLSCKKSENLENSKNSDKNKETNKSKPKPQILTRTYSSLAKGILSPKQKNIPKKDLNQNSNKSNNYNRIKDNIHSDKNIIFQCNPNKNNNNNNNKNNFKNLNKFYKINYNIRQSHTSKNIIENTNKKPLEYQANIEKKESLIKANHLKNKISINYLSKPNVRINSACNLVINNKNNPHTNNSNNSNTENKKAKIKSNNYLSKISKALQMRQSPKEIDKKNFQLDYVVCSNKDLNEFNMRIEKNNNKQNKIILSNNLDSKIKNNFSHKINNYSNNCVNYNEKFYNEIKTRTSLDNLNSDSDDDLLAKNIGKEEEEGNNSENNFNPLEEILTTEKDINNNCLPYECDEDYDYANIDDQIYLKNTTQNLNYLHPKNFKLNNHLAKADNLNNSERNIKVAVIKCLEKTLSTFDNLKLEKDENLQFSNRQQNKQYNVDNHSNRQDMQIHEESIIKDNLALKNEVNENNKKSEFVNNYKRSVVNLINDKLTKKEEKPSLNIACQSNKFFEKFILEKQLTNKNENNNKDIENIYKRKKNINLNSNSNNILANINDKIEVNSSQTAERDYIITKRVDFSRVTNNNVNANTENVLAKSNKNLVKIENNENLVTNLNNSLTNKASSFDNNKIKKNYNYINNDITNNNINHNYPEKNLNSLNNTDKLNIANADKISEFRSNFSQANFNLKTNENQKKREYHISFDSNSNKFQSFRCPFDANNIKNDEQIPFKIRERKSDTFKKLDEENNFECPEDLHYFYVKTLQKGKNFIVNFD